VDKVRVLDLGDDDTLLRLNLLSCGYWTFLDLSLKFSSLDLSFFGFV